jgi:peptide/nickel transport system permease protein
MDFSTPVLSTRDKKRKAEATRDQPSSRRSVRAGRIDDSLAVSIGMRLRADRAAGAALTLIVLLALAAVFAPLLSPYGAEAIQISRANLAPSPSHPFGTDDLGRDLFLRVMSGGRVTLAVGLVAALIAVGVGALIGALAGYRGGWVDALLMRLTDLALSIPAFFIVLLLGAVLTPGLIVVCVIIGLTQWMEVARVARSVVMSVKRNEFVDAARALGAPGWRILFRHVLGHAGAPILVGATIAVAQAIMTESALSFLGFGVQPPAASWGVLLQDAQSQLATAPWLALFPGTMIFLVVLSFHTLGDFLRSALDTPKPVKG